MLQDNREKVTMSAEEGTGKRARQQKSAGRRRLVVDVGACSRCAGCVELVPQLFRLRDDTGLIEVIDTAELDEEAVAEAMKYCPEQCIYWEDE
jgi:ferredoxin